MYVVAFLQSLSQVMPPQWAGPDPTRDPPQRPCKSPLGRVIEENVRASLRIRSHQVSKQNVRASLRIRSHLRCRKSFFENLIQSRAFFDPERSYNNFETLQSQPKCDKYWVTVAPKEAQFTQFSKNAKTCLCTKRKNSL